MDDLTVLPDEPQAQLHVAAAAVERLIFQELGIGHESIGQVLRIAIGVLIQGTIVGRQAKAEVAMIKGVIGFGAEFNGISLRNSRVLEYGHVPDVESGSIDCIATNIP